MFFSILVSCRQQVIEEINEALDLANDESECALDNSAPKTTFKGYDIIAYNSHLYICFISGSYGPKMALVLDGLIKVEEVPVMLDVILSLPATTCLQYQTRPTSRKYQIEDPSHS